MDAEITLPRLNGELQFHSPWEARAFGLAVALNNEGAFDWKNFSEGLAEKIQQAETHGEASTYYERWLSALEDLLVGNKLISAAALEQKAIAQAAHDNHDHT
ncbi:nitrile hydratase accessory protein [Chromatiales bacterium (ex Bugula neritina AB1)]|nr:nitrile hydratase accessory protein [Chromatiales bacterium (ex Bugula neritina AB1)]